MRKTTDANRRGILRNAAAPQQGAHDLEEAHAVRGAVLQQLAEDPRSGGRPADELSPRIRKQSVPIGAFMSRQKTTGGEVRRYKPVAAA